MFSGHIDYAIDPAHAAAIRDVRYHGVTCLALLVWDCLLTFDEDVQYIWTMRNKNPSKWVYFFLRYVVMLACVVHTWFIGPLVIGSNPLVFCRIWQNYVVAFSQILASLLEFILASRIIALYNRSRRVAFLLSFLILTEIAGTVRLLSVQKGVVFYQTCLLLQLTKNGRNQSILSFIVHCMFIGLTLFKYFLAFRAGWNRTPLVSLVVRDGTTMYATIFFIFLSLLVVCGLENEREIAIFFWIVSLFSLTGCRMILRMERLARREGAVETFQPIFTSQLSIRTIDTGGRDQSPP